MRAAEERWRHVGGELGAALVPAPTRCEHQLATVREAGGAGSLDEVDGVVGPLVDHLEIEPGAEAAVGAALGDAMLAVVVTRGERRARRARAPPCRRRVGAAARHRSADGPSAQPALGAGSARGACCRAGPHGRPRARRRCSVGCSRTRSWSTSWRTALDLVLDAARSRGGHPRRVAPRRLRPVAGRRGRAGHRRDPGRARRSGDAGHRRRGRAGRGGARGRVGAGCAGRGPGERAPAGHDRRAPVGARRAAGRGRCPPRGARSRSAGRPPNASGARCSQRDDVVPRRSSCRLAELRARVDALHERLREAPPPSRRSGARVGRAARRCCARERGGLERTLNESARAHVALPRSRTRRRGCGSRARSRRCAPSTTSSRTLRSTRRHPPVPEGTTLAGRARELERDLRLMGPINPLALDEYTRARGASPSSSRSSSTT